MPLPFIHKYYISSYTLNEVIHEGCYECKGTNVALEYQILFEHHHDWWNASYIRYSCDKNHKECLCLRIVVFMAILTPH